MRPSVMRFMNRGPLKVKSGIKGYKCLPVLAVIRIARPQMPFHSVHCGFEGPVFSLRGHGTELDSINQTMDFCWFSFQGGGRTDGFGAAEPYKPLAGQTFESARLCAPPSGPHPLTDVFSNRTDHSYKEKAMKVALEPELGKGRVAT